MSRSLLRVRGVGQGIVRKVIFCFITSYINFLCLLISSSTVTGFCLF